MTEREESLIRTAFGRLVDIMLKDAKILSEHKRHDAAHSLTTSVGYIHLQADLIIENIKIEEESVATHTRDEGRRRRR